MWAYVRLILGCTGVNGAHTGVLLARLIVWIARRIKEALKRLLFFFLQVTV